MKKQLSLLALLLAFTLIISVLSGCSSDGLEPSTTAVEKVSEAQTAAVETKEAQSEAPQETEEAEQTQEDEQQTSLKPEQEDSTPAQPDLEISLPLADELITFTMFCSGVAPSVTAVLPEGYNDENALAIKQLEAETNVRIDFQAVDGFVMAEKFSLMMASGEWTDMISGLESLYTGGVSAAYEEEVIYDLTGLTDYLKNYTALLDVYPEFQPDAYTDDGRMLSILGFKDESIIETGGGIRKDYLDALGLEMPNTYDELYEAGMAIKAAYDTSATFYFTSALIPSLAFSAGFDLPYFDITGSDNSFYQIEGQVQSALVADNLKEMLIMLKRWYDDGLMLEDWYTQRGGSTAEAVIYSGDCAVWWGTLINLTKFNNLAETEGFTSVAMPNLLREEGQINHMTESGYTSGASISITTMCDETLLPVILTYIDYLFTEAGRLLVNYGIEGLSYEFDENSQPQYTENVYSYADGASTFTVLLAKYTASDGILPSFYDGDRAVRAKYDEVNFGSVELYTNDGSDNAYVLPTLTLNTGEQQVISQFLADCETHAATCLVKFIIGDMDIEAEWDDYVDIMLNTLGLKYVLEAKQSAYDRYLAR